MSKLFPQGSDDEKGSTSPKKQEKPIQKRSSHASSSSSTSRSPSPRRSRSPSSGKSRPKVSPVGDKGDKCSHRGSRRHDDPNRSSHRRRQRSRSPDRNRHRHRSRSGSGERRHKHRNRSRSHDRSSRSPYRRRRSRSRSRSREYRYRREGRRSYRENRETKRKMMGLTSEVLMETMKSLEASEPSSSEKPSDLPLDHSGGPMTPQLVVQQAMAVMNAKAKELTGISLPKYYNPAAVNPLKYAEQQQKRKLLWQGKEKAAAGAATSNECKGSNAQIWENLQFSQDNDGKMTAKFRKLMGIKEEAGPSSEIPTSGEDKGMFKKQEVLFRDLDQQYEVARMSTHTHRGVGLGYSSHPAPHLPVASSNTSVQK